MKTIFLTTALLFVFLLSEAQVGTDLQFSQVINKYAAGNDFSVSIGTVPLGKIWKIVGYTIAGGVASDRWYFQTTNIPQIALRRIGSNGEYLDEPVLPLFINENEAVQFVSSTNSATSCYVSIVEYTVLP